MSELTRTIDIRYLWTDQDGCQIYGVKELKLIIKTDLKSFEVSEDNPHTNKIFFDYIKDK